MEGDWRIKVRGTVARIDREDYDKSGRNPKYMLGIVMHPDGPHAITGLPPNVQLPPELLFRAKERDLAALSRLPLAVGDRVTLEGDAAGPRPNLFGLRAVHWD